MNVEKFIVRLYTEEDNWSSDKKMFTPTTIKVNMIEHDQNLKWKNPKSSIVESKGGISNKKNSLGNALTESVTSSQNVRSREKCRRST